MIPTSYKIPTYESFPEFTREKVTEMIKNGEKLVLYDDLVINVKNINHPGGSKMFDPFLNNLETNIEESFLKNKHSRYAEVLLSTHTIGKLKSAKTANSGKDLLSRVNGYQQYRLHQKALEKIDFSKPILEQLNNLTIEEKQCLIDIPTTLENPDKVKFKATQMEEFMYTTDFWRSTTCFQMFTLIGLVYLLSQNLGILTLIGFLPYFFFGVVKWTLIEYYTHRSLHKDLKKVINLDHHLIHHIFPKMKNKLALNIPQVVISLIIFYFLYSFILGRNQTISLLLGVLMGLTLYDIAHYYFHFGPEINIPFLINLKRNHLMHHFRDPNKGFGVSNTFWDKVFKTEHDVKK